MGILSTLQHHLNAAHLRCRLIEAGIPARIVLPFCHLWEKLVHPLLYWRAA